MRRGVCERERERQKLLMVADLRRERKGKGA